MLNSILATFVVCLGMSSKGMPISNYEDQEETHIATTLQPKQAITQDYELTTNATNWTTNTYTDALVIDGKHYDKTTSRANLTCGNNYLNVSGTWYREMMLDDSDHYFVQSIDNTTNVNDVNRQTLRLDQDYVLKTMYVLAITPYNNNVDTNIDLKMQIQIGITSYYAGMTEINNLYMYTTTYKSIMNEFSNYIGMQPTQDIVTDTSNEIEDVDNNYMYSMQENIEELTYYPDTLHTYSIDVSIPITANVTNYFVISNILIAKGQNSGELNYGASCVYGEYWMGFPNNNDITITGTGITPTGTYEYVDIPGIMFEVLGMPFSFISQAFNLTLFPGTPYQINISNLFLALIAVFVFIMLVRLIVKMKS